MKNFVFISPHFPHSYWKWCLALKNRGYNVLGVGDAPYEEIPNECKFALTEYYCCYQMDNYENEKRAIQYFRDKYGEIDWLESMNEYWLEKDAMLRDDFDIKYGIRSSEVKKYKYKSLQKNNFYLAGANICDWVLVNDESDFEKVKKLGEERGYPLFAKPDNGVGSQNTFKINNESEIKHFFDKKIDGLYIVEEFIHGRIVSFDGITNSRGEVIFCDCHLFSASVAEVVEKSLDDVYYCMPFVPDDLKEIGVKVVKSFDIKNRFFHIEFFRTFDETRFGPKNTLIAIEANMRAPGGYTPDLINFANSVSCYDIYADSCAYDENKQDLNKQKYWAVSSSRRFCYNYFHNNDEIFEKYRNNICMYGEYPKVLSDNLGDLYYFAKFDSKLEADEFDVFIRMKK